MNVHHNLAAMGNKESKVTFEASDIPAKPKLNFSQIPPKDAKSNVDDALAILRFVSSLIGLGTYIQVSQKILEAKKHGDNILNFLVNSAALKKLLISTQIKENDCINVACEINAKFDGIKKGREYMLDTQIPEADKRTHVGPAIQACSEVLSLFQNKNYTLWKAPVPASGLLINFAAIYAESAIVCGAILPSHKDRLYTSLEELKQTLSNYKKHCLSARLSLFNCQARTCDEGTEVSYGHWVYDDENLLMYSKHKQSGTGIDFRLEDKWPSVLKNGKLECWEWTWTRYFSPGRFPPRDAYKTAITRGVEYRKQMRLLYSEPFDEAINGVEDTRRQLNPQSVNASVSTS